MLDESDVIGVFGTPEMQQSFIDIFNQVKKLNKLSYSCEIIENNYGKCKIFLGFVPIIDINDDYKEILNQFMKELKRVKPVGDVKIIILLNSKDDDEELIKFNNELALPYLMKEINYFKNYTALLSSHNRNYDANEKDKMFNYLNTKNIYFCLYDYNHLFNLNNHEWARLLKELNDPIKIKKQLSRKLFNLANYLMENSNTIGDLLNAQNYFYSLIAETDSPQIKEECEKIVNESKLNETIFEMLEGRNSFVINNKKGELK